jgi:hypothetical protein
MEQRRAFPSAFGGNSGNSSNSSNSRPPSRQGESRRWQKPERSYVPPQHQQQPTQPKPLNLNSKSEFPTLGSGHFNMRDAFQGTSLADKLRQTIVEEEERASRSRYEKSVKKEDNYVFAIPVSSLMAKRRAEEQVRMDQRRKEIEEEEENYRYQMTGVRQDDEFPCEDENLPEEEEEQEQLDHEPPTHELQ